MANTNAPNGFQPTRNLFGSTANYAQNPYQIATTNTHTFGFGDVVTLLSTGYIDRSLTTDSPVLGIFLGCTYYDTTTQRTQFQQSWTGVTTASGTITAYVCDDPNVVFTVQNSAATAITIADVGSNATFTGNAAPNAYSGISTAALDQTTLGTTNTLPFKIVGLSTYAGNDNTSGYNRVEVKLNDPTLKTSTGL